jgi:hypothetical protein
MDNEEKVREIKQWLDEISAEAAKLTDAMQRVREQVERIQPNPRATNVKHHWPGRRGGSRIR